LGTQQHADVGFDNSLQPGAASGHDGRVVVVRVLARCRQHDGDRGFEFADGISVACGTRIADRENAARRHRVETLVAGAGGLPLHQFLRRGNPRFDLAGPIEGYDARTIELERFALLGRPPFDRPIQLRIDGCGFLGFAL